MARTSNKLTALKVKNLSEPGLYSDGNGLYVQVGPNSKSWVFRFMLNKRPRMMGLGSVSLVSLAEARDEALAARKMVRAGIDPIVHRKSKECRSENPDFSDAAEQYIDQQKAGWRNAKHVSQWTNTLTTYAYPVIGDIKTDEVTTEHVLYILQPIWQTKPETAGRIRGRIERILDWAKTRGYREGENPARWRGHLEHNLPPLSRIKRVSHHRAIPWQELSAFMAELHSHTELAAQALLLTILTATRTSEVRLARWGEFDFYADIPLWTIPAERMKAGREHRIPLSSQTQAFLNSLPRFSSGYLFEGRKDKPLSENAMLAVLKRMNRQGITVHGFRSSFRDWCAEQTAFPREIAEAALAHVNRDRVEAAYLRTDLLEKRNRLMTQWADYLFSSVEKDLD